MPHPRIHSTGSLDAFNPILVTPVIGTEFPKDSCNIVDDILNAPNAEQRIRDLAVLGTSYPYPQPNYPHPPTITLTNTQQSQNAASSSSAPSTTSPTTSKNTSSWKWAA